MTAKDYYKTLGVSRDASKEEIKKAYKKLAKQHHPDMNKGDPAASEKFKEINEAAAVLGDDEKRKHYDTYGTADTQGMGGGEGFSGFDFGNTSFEMDFGDIFDSFFGGGVGGRSRRGGPRRGSDLRYEFEITLEDASAGATKHITIPKTVSCPDCRGTGAETQSDIQTCDTCRGAGVVRRTQRTAFGLFQTQTSCSDCRGEGKVIKHLCPACDGHGAVHKNTKLEISIPSGSFTGMQLRVRGEGEAGEKGGPSGDLYVQILVKEHEIFERVENDIIVQVPLTFIQATLGAEIDVPTLSGTAKLGIPQGTQSNTVFRMKGKGIPDVEGSGAGAELVKVIVEVPTKITAEQKELLLAFDKTYIKPKKGFLERVFQ